MQFIKQGRSIALMIGILLGVGLGMLVPATPTVKAIEIVEEESTTCYSQMGIFVTNLLDFGSAKDYWADLLVRNSCQQDDIFALDDEIEVLMAQLREKYSLHCNSEEITEYQTEIREKKMEQYFVRHIVEVDEKSSYKKDIDAFDDDALQNSLTQVTGDMIEKYVEKKGWVEETELREMIQEWSEQYEDRIPKYLSCTSSAWQEVADDWKDFQEDLSILIEAFQGDGSTKKLIAQNEEELAEIKEERTGEKNAEGKKSIGNFLKKRVAMKINNVTPKKALEEIKADLKQNSQAVNSQDLLDAMAIETERYKQEATEAELIGRYTLLYLDGSASITSDLVYRIELLRLTVRQTSLVEEYLPGLAESSKGIRKK